jgi:hypothetical protein
MKAYIIRHQFSMIFISGLFSIMLLGLVAVIRNDQVRAEFTSRLFGFTLETKHHDVPPETTPVK